MPDELEAVSKSPAPLFVTIRPAAVVVPEREATGTSVLLLITSSPANGAVVPIPTEPASVMVSATPDANISLMLPSDIAPGAENLARRLTVPLPTMPPPAPAQFPVSRQTIPVASGNVYVLAAVESVVNVLTNELLPAKPRLPLLPTVNLVVPDRDAVMIF